MTHLCHVLDDAAGWEQRVGLTQLLERVPRDAVQQSVVDVSGQGLGAALGMAAVTRCARPFGSDVLAGARLRKLLAARGATAVHAWGLRAAAAAHNALPDAAPLTLSLFDPVVTPKALKLVRTLAERVRFSVACGSGTVRRRLVEGGVPIERCVVIRPGVDFAAVNEAKKSTLRRELGISPPMRMALLAPPVSRGHGHLEAAFAVALYNFVMGGWRVVVPGSRPELPSPTKGWFKSSGLGEPNPQREEAQQRGQAALAHATPRPRGITVFEGGPAAESVRHFGLARTTSLGPSEPERIGRFLAALSEPEARDALVYAPGAEAMERLVCVADVLVVPAHGDISTTAVAWAMAAGVPVIAAASYATAELVTHQVNGLLYKHTPGQSDTAAIYRLLADTESHQRYTEAARGQAYEVFSVRRYAEQHMRLWENLHAGRRPDEGIVDSAGM